MRYQKINNESNLTDKIQKLNDEKQSLKEKLKNDHPFKSKKQLNNFYDNNEELINKYNLDKKQIKKRITTINYNLRYNTDPDFRIAQNKNIISIKTNQKLSLNELQVKYDELNNILTELQIKNDGLINENNILKSNIKELINENNQNITNINIDEIKVLNEKLVIEKENNFNLNRLNIDQKNKITNLRNEIKKLNLINYQLKNNNESTSSSSSTSDNDIENNNNDINISYPEIKDLSDMKINKLLFNFGFKYTDLKDLSFHEKKQLLNKNKSNNDKFKRLFNNINQQ